MMRIHVSGHSFVFPPKCACCCGAANAELSISATKSSGKKVVHKKTHVWDVPYCDRCLEHVRAMESAERIARVLGFLSILLGGFLCYFDNLSLGITVGTVAFTGT